MVITLSKLHKEIEMSFWQTPATLIGTFGTGGIVLGGIVSQALLSPKNQGECTMAINLSSFYNPCLNALGMNANGFDPEFLFVLGGVLFGVVGALIGWLSSKVLSLK